MQIRAHNLYVSGNWSDPIVLSKSVVICFNKCSVFESLHDPYIATDATVEVGVTSTG